MRRYFLVFLGILVIALDRSLKWLALYKTPASGVFWVKDVGFSLMQNRGIAFGIGFSKPLLLGLIAGILMFVLYNAYKAHKAKRYARFSLFILILFGALSNLYDRLRYGFVVDYLAIFFWPVFNFADAMIVVSVGAIICLFLKQKDKRDIV